MHEQDDMSGGTPVTAETHRPVSMGDGEASARKQPRDPSCPRDVHLRRTLALAERFNSLCALKSDPRKLVELLGGVIANAKDSFTTVASEHEGALATKTPTSEQARCLRDLDGLLRGLSSGAPEASRGLCHALDALLIQCVILEDEAADVRRNAERLVPD